MEADRPERWSWLDIPAWFFGLWPALKEGLHKWVHKDRLECPDCASWRDEADRQANEVLRLQTLLGRQYQEREVAPSTVTPEDIAVAYDLKAVPDLTPRQPNLEQVIAKMAGAAIPVAPERREAPALAFEFPVAVRFPKTEEDVRKLHSDCKAIAEEPKWRMSQDDYVQASLGAGVRISCIDQWGKVIMADRAKEAP